jgi:hypothetical protein
MGRVRESAFQGMRNLMSSIKRIHLHKEQNINSWESYNITEKLNLSFND